jgi:hypothetical protein
MAVSPGTYNISLQRRADYSVMLQFKDGNGIPINLTSWIVEAQAWNQARTIKYADFTIAYTSRVTGTVSISLTNNQTTSLPNESYYDVRLTNESGIKEYYLEGTIHASEGYTG